MKKNRENQSPNRANTNNGAPTRREFLAWSGKAAAASALAGVALPHVHAAEDNTIRLALIGCGGRGTGATGNAFESTGGPLKLYAMADLFENKLFNSYNSLNAKYGDRLDVPTERQFLGFDAYQKAMDCLRPGDVALLTTHSAFRMLQFEYAIKKGLNVFMEKSFAPDPGGTHKMLRLGEEAEKKNLKVGCGLMCRHSTARQAMIEKIRDGEMGQIQLIRAYRLDGARILGRRPAEENEVYWQIRHPYSFFWPSSGCFIEMMIHQVDECCWIKNGWPVSAHGLGGRLPNTPDCGQNFDAYSIEYTFADGTKALVGARYMSKCHSDFSTYVHGTKCAGQFSGNVHAPTVQLFKDQIIAATNVSWRPERETVSPYVREWSLLLDAIRNNRPHNEVKRAAFSNMASIMGRAAVHSQKIITWDQMMASNFFFAPDIDKLTEKGPAPVREDAQGRYPTPMPGQWSEV